MPFKLREFLFVVEAVTDPVEAIPFLTEISYVIPLTVE